MTIAWLVRVLLAGECLLALLCARLLVDRLGWPLWAGIGSALAVPLALHAMAIGLQALAGAWHRAGAGSSAAAGRPSEALRAWLGETLASLRSFLLQLPWQWQRPLPSGADPARMPVLLVHGYFCNQAIWRPLARWLAARGHPVAGVNLAPPFAGIDRNVPALDAAVEALRARTGAPQVAVCGHSMGGLVIRAWMRDHGCRRVATAITLGSPHQGTWSARFGLGHNVAQMRPGSRWLAALTAAEPPAGRALFTVIFSLHDNIVMPQAAQTLPGARHHVLRGVGHMALVNAAAVRPLLADALDRATPGAGCQAVDATPEPRRHP